MNIFIYLNGNRSEIDFYAEEYQRKFKDGDKIICVNGGFDLASSIGITPDVIIGDLDSKRVAIPKGIKIIKHPPEKDLSDFELAINYSRQFQPERIVVYGALGGRKDHEIINLVVLAYTDIPMVFIEKEVEIYNVKKSLVISNSKNRSCSLVSLSEGTIVKSLDGFKYKLAYEELKPSSRGLSNIITENIAKIELNGKAVLFFLNK